MPAHLATFLAQAAPPTPPAPPGGGMDMPIMMLFLFAIMYFVMIRPQRKKQQELERQLKALKTGDRVITSGGIHGVVANVRGDNSTVLTLKIADNVKIEIEKNAVATVVRDKEPTVPATTKA